MEKARQLTQSRRETHGPFEIHANTKVALQAAFRINSRRGLKAVQRVGLDMIFEKISRIAVGDPDFIDHWEDISGYSQLVADWLREEQNERADV